MPRASGASSNRGLSLSLIAHGVLDRPPSRAMTTAMSSLDATGSHHQLVDRLERAVRLNDREEHLVEALVLARPERHRQAADVELSGVLDGLDQAVAGRLATHFLERGDGEPADQIAFERDELGGGFDGRLILRHHLERRA